MGKHVSKAASMELAFLAALESIHADVDTSEIAEIQDWSGAVRGKFYGASVKETLLPPEAMDVMRRWHATNTPGSSAVNVSGAISMASANTATHLSQYSQMAISQLIAVGISESSAEAWHEFVRRFRPLIARVITRVVDRFSKDSNALIEDLVQEVFLKLCHDDYRALKGVATMRDEKSAFGLLKVVAANVANDHFRRAAAFRASPAQEQEPIEALPELDKRKASSVIERRILLEEIDKVLKTLSHERNFERDRAIFWLYYSQGLTAKAIAALPGITLSVKGVESTLFRLTRQIRSALTQRAKKTK